ncbi:class 1 fructose-bisphosphatase [Pajaroellobacter abortibovis]|uniref:Fructose-1,6-bisphosphatase class 1 n=1 Tax=Pajaroellobacter abortibovis TaxID=1882918 RepID=A0A1L6MYZ0_9BACT|nr:class 1 fructose-bisphosphatase [Pajaroellobacter abortibovis]APS00710.1 fructose-bisphosphatase [Pajaroellobacter abortibovis]
MQKYNQSGHSSVLKKTFEQFMCVELDRGRNHYEGLLSLLHGIASAIRGIGSKLRVADLNSMLGTTGNTNVQGESVQKLDVFANEVMMHYLRESKQCCLLISEELDETFIDSSQGEYIVLFDPLDGSSNLDVNVNVGTIFAVFEKSAMTSPSPQEALRSGRKFLMAGYALYGPSTILVLATNRGVNSFVLDPGVGEFFLSRPSIRIPSQGRYYSCNEGNFTQWGEPIQKWNRWVKEEASYVQRYVGSLAADAHRTLCYGGLFLYPADKKHQEGKLRLLYEANPIAYVVEHAGGVATDGVKCILDIVPTSIHQRTPLIFGSTKNVNQLMGWMKEGMR